MNSKRDNIAIESNPLLALREIGVTFAAIAQESPELNISGDVPQANDSKSRSAQGASSLIPRLKTLNIFLIGTGRIGTALLRQIQKQRMILAKSKGIDIRLIAVGNADKMVLSGKSLPLDSWSDALELGGVTINLRRLFETMIGFNFPNSIFVDCTDSSEVVSLYDEILGSGVSIVTPNKIANSGRFEQYKSLKETAAKHGAKFLYETNVAAGLPVIGTLNDLLASGDRILKIEAVLSGTLSFIFNSMSKEKRFAALVREAMDRGLTEPDIRIDLKGEDVAKKTLILAREAGLLLEPEDVVLEPILPENCREAETLESFFKLLESENTAFETRRSAAEAKNRKIRYVTVIQKDQALVKFKEVDQSDPFYWLTGSDNMIVFVTERYREHPLVIKGPGAGSEVTAGGVFADILRVGSCSS